VDDAEVFCMGLLLRGITIQLSGAPISKARPRSCIRNGSIHYYSSQHDVEDEVRSHIVARLTSLLQPYRVQQYLDYCRKLQVSFNITITFNFQAPFSGRPLQRNSKLWKDTPTDKPDIDNLLKFYLDAGNLILWPDDSSVISVHCEKKFSEDPNTLIKIVGTPKMSIPTQFEKILSQISPSEFKHFLSQLNESIELIGETDETSNDLNKLERYASFIKRFADHFSDRLKKIARIELIGGEEHDTKI
jgi:Holliday junction resolvase RusA-like endonuclease